MKKLELIILLTLLILGCTPSDKKKKIKNEEYGEITENKKSESKIERASEKRDKEMYIKDLNNYDKEWEDNLPIGKLPFPVEKYKTPGNALWNLRDSINGIPIAGNFLVVGEDEAFFNILVKTKIKEPLSYRAIYSRNHPNYFGQGIVKHELGNIDWIAIKPKSNEGYAIISGRLFELNKGKTILVYQESDGGIDFLQIDDSIRKRNKDEVSNYFDRIKLNKKVNQIFIKD